MENLVIMKKSLLILLPLLISSISFSQKEKGILNLGIGVGNGGLKIETNNNKNHTSRISTPALGASYEIEVHPDITVGPYLGFNRVTYRNDSWVHNKSSHTNVWLGGRGAYYFDNLMGLHDQFDFYAGAALGFAYSNRRETSNIGFEPVSSSSLNAPIFGIFVGGRYWFKDNFAAFAETGLGASWLNLGISLKM